MPKHFIFDKLSDKKNRLKIALQVSKLGFSPIVMPLSFSVTSESSSILLKKLRAFRERNVYRAGWGKIWEGGGRVGCALGPLTGVIAQGWDYLALIFSLLVSRSRKTQGRAYERPGQN